ncbi:MAG: FKBP-type peptidyl-prolyl cis-trans isomerase [Opitutae bacterium]
MKFTSLVTTGLIGMSLYLAASAEDAVKFNVPGVSAGATPAAAPATGPAAPAKPKFTEAQIAEAYGWYMGAQMGLRQMEFTPAQIEAMARGMVGVATGAQPTFDAKEIGPEVEAFLAKKNDAFMTKLRNQNLMEGLAFFTKLKENKNVVELPSGLKYEVVKAGTGATPKLGQIVSMHYTGSFASGQMFDNSKEKSQGQPVEVAIQNGQVIPGLIEGLQKIGVGGTIKLYVPPSLAYGDQGSQVIPPGATLVFEIELVGVKDAPAAPAPAAK